MQAERSTVTVNQGTGYMYTVSTEVSSTLQLWNMQCFYTLATVFFCLIEGPSTNQGLRGGPGALAAEQMHV